ncbi:MAG: hypothetical protein ABSF26_06695 [Thermoguttaceae bacterium]|jgi:multidrug resistance efflux pump
MAKREKEKDTPANSKVIQFLQAIRQSRSSMCDARERMYQRVKTLLQHKAAAPEELDKVSLDFEEAKIRLAEAEIAILKAQSQGNHE